MYLSYYDKKWNWINIEIRRSKNNDLMLIVPFNKQGLSQVGTWYIFMRLTNLEIRITDISWLE